MAGYWKEPIKRYVLHLAGDFLYAHRVVYYLRTGEDPENKDVRHGDDNLERDNRKELTLYARKTTKQRTRRNRRHLRGEQLRNVPCFDRCDLCGE